MKKIIVMSIVTVIFVLYQMVPMDVQAKQVKTSKTTTAKATEKANKAAAKANKAAAKANKAAEKAATKAEKAAAKADKAATKTVTTVNTSNTATTGNTVTTTNKAATTAATTTATVAAPATTAASSNDYGVFIGMDPSNISKLVGYKEVVIDASEYTKSQIDYLHKNGVKVYSYLNIGSIEDFRPYYKQFINITLGNYENWPGEKWIDISNTKWQDYLVNVLAKNLADKGVDGFFLDNVDVYSVYNNDKIFNGVLNVMNRLDSTYKRPLIANGGYDFFTKAMDKNLAINKLVYGVDTESVYTTVVDYDTNEFAKNSNKDRQDAVDYLQLLQAKGLNIYIIEYTKNASLKSTINDYFNNLKFKCYISSNLSLN